MSSLLRGCRALYTPAYVRSYPTPLIGDGPVLRFWRTTENFSNTNPKDPKISFERGPTWDTWGSGEGVWGYVPDHWRGNDRSSGEYGRLWRANGGGGTVVWYGRIFASANHWRGLGGIMMDHQDTTPWGVLNLRISGTNQLTAQSSYNRITYVEAMQTGDLDALDLVNKPLVVAGVLRPRPGANTRLELWVNGVLQANSVDRDDFYQFAQFFPNTSQGIVYIGSPMGIATTTAGNYTHTRMLGLWDRALSPSELMTMARHPIAVENQAFTARRSGVGIPDAKYQIANLNLRARRLV